jgi:G3E family GTPase
LSVPITLVTGFLGAGKSTLINKVLADNPGLKFGLVINEFGDVKLESQIVEAREEDAVTELSNGCMCCVVRTDLLRSVGGLLDVAPKTGHIILEASGLSDPVPIANAFLNDDLGGRVRFDAIVCVVDPTNFRSALGNFTVSETQLVYADFILLSKVDVASAQEVEDTKKLILEAKPEARILELDEDFPTSLVFDTSEVDHSELAGLEIEEHSHDNDDDHDHEHEHEDHGHEEGEKVYHHAHDAVDTLFYKSAVALDLDRFGLVLRDLPREIIRAKGFLYFDDRKAARSKYILQMVGARPVLDAKPWARGEEKMSAIVFIGKGFDKERLLEALRSCERN